MLNKLPHKKNLPISHQENNLFFTFANLKKSTGLKRFEIFYELKENARKHIQKSTWLLNITYLSFLTSPSSHQKISPFSLWCLLFNFGNEEKSSTSERWHRFHTDWYLRLVFKAIYFIVLEYHLETFQKGRWQCIRIIWALFLFQFLI